MRHSLKARLIAGSGSAWIPVHNHPVVGLLVLESAEDHLLLEHVAVDPDVQGLGMGSRLLRLAEERAEAQGLNAVRLYTNVAMTENLTSTPRHGYRPERGPRRKPGVKS